MISVIKRLLIGTALITVAILIGLAYVNVLKAIGPIAFIAPLFLLLAYWIGTIWEMKL